MKDSARAPRTGAVPLGGGLLTLVLLAACSAGGEQGGPSGSLPAHPASALADDACASCSPQLAASGTEGMPKRWDKHRHVPEQEK
jgi:hypothetical protein